MNAHEQEAHDRLLDGSWETGEEEPPEDVQWDVLLEKAKGYKLAANQADRYAAKLERALERIRTVARLVVDDDVRDLIESLTRFKDDRTVIKF